MKIKELLTLVGLFLCIVSPVIAHPGRTASDGCHYCRTNCDDWGEAWDERHCHGGGDAYSPPAPRVYEFPEMNAAWEFDSNSYPDKTYDIIVKLEDSSPSQYSAVLSEYKGGDPGPNADFYNPTFRYYGVEPGTWYLNVKKEINGYWSTVAYWQVEVPAWVEPETIVYPTSYPDYDEEPAETASVNNDLSMNLDDTDKILLGGAISLVALVYAGKKLS